MKRIFRSNIEMEIDANQRQISPAYAKCMLLLLAQGPGEKQETIIVMLIYVNVCLLGSCNFAINRWHRGCCFP